MGLKIKKVRQIKNESKRNKTKIKSEKEDERKKENSVCMWWRTCLPCEYMLVLPISTEENIFENSEISFL